MWQTKEWLENTLKNYSNDRSIQKILSVSSESIGGKGENYLSEMERVILSVVMGSGEITKKTFIQKNISGESAKRQIVQNSGFFHTEIKVYRTVLNQMKKLMESVDDWREPLWSDCIASDAQIGLLLEDLSPLGYKVVDRKQGFDIPHAKAALSSLARFHAMSVVLYEKGILRKEEFGYFPFASKNDPLMQTFTTDGLQTLGDVIMTSWPTQWYDVGNRIKNLAGNIIDKMMDISQEENIEFKVLNHGDTWVNNILFKYDLETGNLCGVRFIDYQISHWNSPGFDIQYLLRSSLKADLVTLYYEDLLHCYHTSLLNTFKIMHHEPKISFSLPQLHTEMDRTVCAGFFSAALILPVILADKEDVIEIEDMDNLDNESVANKRKKIYSGLSYTNNMMTLLPLIENKGIF